MGLGIVKLGQGQWAVKDGNLLAAKDTNGRLKNAEFTVTRGTRATYVGRDGLIKESNLQDVNLVNNGDFSELGSEIADDNTITNSNGGIITKTSDLNYNVISDGTTATQFLPRITFDGLTSGKTYKLIITPSNQSGDIDLKLYNGSSFLFQNNDMSSELVYYFTSGVNNSFIAWAGQQTFNVDFTISLKEVDPNDYWTFSGDSFTFPDGAARIARTTSTTFIQQNVLTSGKLYKVEFDVLDKDDNNGTFIVRLGSNNVYDVSTYEGTRFSKYITSAGIDFRIYSSSDNGVIYVDNIVVSEVKTDTPRIDFTDNTDGHLLLEPQSTNLLTYSEDFSQWDKLSSGTGSTPIITSNYATSPDGTNNATRCIFNINSGTTTSDYSRLRYLFTSTTPTLTIFVKSNTSETYELNLTYSGDSVNVIDVTPNQWTRVEYQASASGTFGFRLELRGSYTTNNFADVLIWGAQAEALSYPTSYIPTNGSTVTRDADTCTGSGEAVDFNSEEGVLYAEISALADDSQIEALSLSDGTLNNRVVIFKWSTSNRIQVRVTASGTTVFNNGYDVTDITDYNKIALKWKANDFALWINGTEVLTDNSGTSPIGLNSLQFDSGIGTNTLYSKCKALRVYKEALSDTDLQNLTSL